MKSLKKPYVVYFNDREASYIELSELYDIRNHWVTAIDKAGRTVYIPAASILYMQEDED